jgi:hypothetical protein
VELFALKLVLTPALIAFATLLGRRFGQSIAGWLVGFPFTSGPVSLFLALEHGSGFAAAAAVGSIASVIAQGAFALVYARSTRLGWSVALLLAALAFAIVGVALGLVALTPLVLLAAAWALLFAASRSMPARTASGRGAPPPRWDLPARMVVATIVVIALTTFAPVLGAFASGVLSGFPLYATVLAVFAHRVVGAPAAQEVMRGLVAGLFAFAAFFFVIATSLVPLGLAGAFGLAIGVILVLQAVSFMLLRRGIP